MGILNRVMSAGQSKIDASLKAAADAALALEAETAAMGDAEMLSAAAALRERAAGGEPLSSLEPEAFALVREATFRELGFRHFPVQLMGAHVLADGGACEMATGEGKTVVAMMAAFLMSLAGKGVHVVTVNDYLASRDADQCARVLGRLGTTVGCVRAANMSPQQRRSAYGRDVTYGTTSAFGFDYLRDNMASDPSGRVQRGHAFAIVDEVDSVLIDEARTPMIISGPGDHVDRTWGAYAAAVRGLKVATEEEVRDLEGDQKDGDADAVVDLSRRTVRATDKGLDELERRLGFAVYGEGDTVSRVNHLNQALRAELLFQRDVDYIVSGGEVKIVDASTGRVMEGRRYSDGLHQAIEAKEGVEVKDEDSTHAQATIQNYFRLYGTLSGMTGTARSCDAELRETYGLDVHRIPTNRPSRRVDHTDRVFGTSEARWEAVADLVQDRKAAGQPVLVGTESVEDSERLSAVLSARGVGHAVLNAKNDAAEARVVALAGLKGAVTISTNMAGRGTDIKLGGDPKVLADDAVAAMRGANDVAAKAARRAALAQCERERREVEALGGLYVVGCGHGRARRIDDQLRGRAGRQGDPGETVFMVSFDDPLFLGMDPKQRARCARQASKDPKGASSASLDKVIDAIQRRVEDNDFGQRKNVLEYDDVLNQQRLAVYRMRDMVMEGDLSPFDTATVAQGCAEWVVERSTVDGRVDAGVASRALRGLLGSHVFKFEVASDNEGGVEAKVAARVAKEMDARVRPVLALGGYDDLLKSVALSIIDDRWPSYLQELDYIKTGIGLRGIGQQDPLVAFKQESADAFDELLRQMRYEYASTVCRIQVSPAAMGAA